MKNEPSLPRMVKLSISCEWGAATIPNFELKRDVDLAEQIDTICKELKAPEPSTSYALFVEVDSTYLKPEVSILLSALFISEEETNKGGIEREREKERERELKSPPPPGTALDWQVTRRD